MTVFQVRLRRTFQERMMRVVDNEATPRRQDVAGLRGLLIAMSLSTALWAGMLGVVHSLLN